jgi:hypothetical protein
MQSCPEPLWPSTQSCLRGGMCMSQTTCQCADGWIGEGDFVYQAPSCDTNVLAVTVMYSMTAVANLIVSVGAVYFLRALRRKAKVRKIAFAICCLASTWCISVMAILRAASPQTTAIGTYVPTTVLFAIGSGTFWSGALLFVYAFLTLTASQVKFKPDSRVSFARVQAQLRWGFPLIGLAMGVAELSVLCMLAAQSRTSMYVLALVHYVLLGLSMAVIGAWLIPKFVTPLIHDLSESLASGGGESAKIRVLLLKLKRFKIELRNQNLFNLPIAVAFGAWPWLQQQSVFWLPVPYITTALLIALALYIEFPVTTKHASSMQSSPNDRNDTGTSGGQASVHVMMGLPESSPP